MKYSNCVLRGFVTAIILQTSVACSRDAGEDGVEAGGNFRVRAEVSHVITARGLAEGTVPDGGQYRFSYPRKTDSYATAPCTFTEGVGLAAAEDGHFLTWADVTDYDNKGYVFFLDNVPLANNGADGFYGVAFSGDEKEKYAAGIDNKDAANDIVWGSCTLASRESVNLDFKLYHRMARVSVRVSGTPGVLDDAVVELDGVVVQPNSFNRRTGEIDIDKDNAEYSSLTLRGGTVGWGLQSDEYETAAFILPPQSLREGADRPRLRIIVPESAGEEYAGTYSAVLPMAMTVTTDGITSMQTLRFAAGQHLVLNVNLLHDDEKPPLEFRPAVVVPWEFKGNFTIGADEEGIYKLADLQHLITAYNKLKDKDTSRDWRREVDRYGREKDGKWIFKLFGNLVFAIDENTELFADSDFSFEFFGHTVTIGEKAFGEEQLADLIKELTKKQNEN